jgi:hypothetical protein
VLPTLDMLPVSPEEMYLEAKDIRVRMGNFDLSYEVCSHLESLPEQRC